MLKQEINPVVAVVAVIVLALIVFGIYYLATGTFFHAPKEPPGGFQSKKMSMPPLTRPTNVQHGPIGP